MTGGRFADLLANSPKRLQEAWGSFWKRHTTPSPDAERNKTCTDRW